MYGNSPRVEDLEEYGVVVYAGSKSASAQHIQKIRNKQNEAINNYSFI